MKPGILILFTLLLLGNRTFGQTKTDSINRPLKAVVQEILDNPEFNIHLNDTVSTIQLRSDEFDSTTVFNCKGKTIKVVPFKNKAKSPYLIMDFSKIGFPNHGYVINLAYVIEELVNKQKYTCWTWYNAKYIYSKKENAPIKLITETLYL